jgi:hypothetical protein
VSRLFLFRSRDARLFSGFVLSLCSSKEEIRSMGMENRQNLTNAIRNEEENITKE